MSKHQSDLADAAHKAHVAAMTDRDAPLLELDYLHYDQAAGSLNIPRTLADGSVSYMAVPPVAIETSDGTHASAAASHPQAPGQIAPTEPEQVRQAESDHEQIDDTVPE